MKESELLGLVKERLQPFCRRLIRINGGTFLGAGGSPVKTYRLYGKGKVALQDEVLPDFIGLLDDGRMLAVEVKSPTRKSNRASQDREMRQRRFLDEVLASGGVAILIESVEKLDRLVSELKTQIILRGSSRLGEMGG